MYISINVNENDGFTFIEMLVVLVSIAIIAITLTSFITTSFSTNTQLVTDTDTLTQANLIFNNITDVISLGSNFSTTGPNTLNFLTSEYTASGEEINASLIWDGTNIRLLKSDSAVATILNNSSIINDLRFDIVNPSTINVTLSIAQKNYSTTIHSLNFIP